MYLVRLSRQAEKDKKLLKAAGLEAKARQLLEILRVDPLKNPPPCEALVGNLSDFYSRRINIQHRLVYSFDTEEVILKGIHYQGTVKVARMWTHYDRT
ncbi:MAG: Txe/YoeB family addiction module toxin [Lachnospiraceae bacterium]|nr:Txe/YoeB family addiction module toxin [Lachnospiraceae bacterium]